MVRAMTYQALIADLAEAKEGSKELDREICFQLDEFAYPVAFRTYTRWIDSALTLVPPGMTWSVTSSEAWVATSHYQWFGTAATPALALCIAALRAREGGQ